MTWTDRLTGIGGIPIDEVEIDHNDSQGSEKKDREEKTAKCPFSYRPTRSLDFNNKTYTTSPSIDTSSQLNTLEGSYVIERMGPKHIPANTLIERPRYLGDIEKKIM